ncbi:hypothetical protein G7046_g5942 [Stylonectria norvegica]|nr:hypothetical protein G7046_g5942 [Stylonectria norvegica]
MRSHLPFISIVGIHCWAGPATACPCPQRAERRAQSERIHGSVFATTEAHRTAPRVERKRHPSIMDIKFNYRWQMPADFRSYPSSQDTISSTVASVQCAAAGDRHHLPASVEPATPMCMRPARSPQRRTRGGVRMRREAWQGSVDTRRGDIVAIQLRTAQCLSWGPETTISVAFCSSAISENGVCAEDHVDANFHPDPFLLVHRGRVERTCALAVDGSPQGIWHCAIAAQVPEVPEHLTWTPQGGTALQFSRAVDLPGPSVLHQAPPPPAPATKSFNLAWLLFSSCTHSSNFAAQHHLPNPTPTVSGESHRLSYHPRSSMSANFAPAAALSALPRLPRPRPSAAEGLALTLPILPSAPPQNTNNTISTSLRT